MKSHAVKGWMIDFRTATSVFNSGSNERISHLVEQCENGLLKICHCEVDQFRQSPQLIDPFIENQNCVYEPDDAIYGKCARIDQNVDGKTRLTGNDAALYITATAVAKNFGVISDHRSDKFATVYDLCCKYGVPVFSIAEYFESN